MGLFENPYLDVAHTKATVGKPEFMTAGYKAQLKSIVLLKNHGNVLPHYKAMGSPLDPTEAQVEELNRQTALGQPERLSLKDGHLELHLERNALVLLRIKP